MLLLWGHVLLFWIVRNDCASNKLSNSPSSPLYVMQRTPQHRYAQLLAADPPGPALGSLKVGRGQTKTITCILMLFQIDSILKALIPHGLKLLFCCQFAFAAKFLQVQISGQEDILEEQIAPCRKSKWYNGRRASNFPPKNCNLSSANNFLQVVVNPMCCEPMKAQFFAFFKWV